MLPLHLCITSCVIGCMFRERRALTRSAGGTPLLLGPGGAGGRGDLQRPERLRWRGGPRLWGRKGRRCRARTQHGVVGGWRRAHDTAVTCVPLLLARSVFGWLTKCHPKQISKPKNRDSLYISSSATVQTNLSVFFLLSRSQFKSLELEVRRWEWGNGIEASLYKIGGRRGR